METYMIHGANHLIECFSFWLAIKVMFKVFLSITKKFYCFQKDGSLKSVSVVQQDEEQEDHAGDIEMLWMYTSEQVSSDEWLEGQFEVRAHYYQDAPQNYTVSWIREEDRCLTNKIFQLRFIGEHGNENSKGWAAIDDFEFIRSECMFKPHDATPPTPEPTESTPAADTPTHCTFQVDDCGFEIEGDGDFKFERTIGI